ncbi:hypothetical protein NL676_009563 [Syzygium grande]|nr:hypothetical protein NL676_009563 [Syzygium grande]
MSRPAFLSSGIEIELNRTPSCAHSSGSLGRQTPSPISHRRVVQPPKAPSCSAAASVELVASAAKLRPSSAVAVDSPPSRPFSEIEKALEWSDLKDGGRSSGRRSPSLPTRDFRMLTGASHASTPVQPEPETLPLMSALPL